ncbi:tRNA adenosine(34) deaminase TadA [Hydrogenispora ethanolica]|nr:tRNA adenosine(34) deaminase TadA [Hydrogenispora ethanolica]
MEVDQLRTDERYMREALAQAAEAGSIGEIPIGAIVVREDRIVARAHNLREQSGDPTAHAEILALREAAAAQSHWRLADATLYSTLEPCPMCAGALVQARVKRLVFGAADPKAGATGSLMNIVQDPRLNHRVEVTSGILAEECGKILKEFFQKRRQQPVS